MIEITLKLYAFGWKLCHHWLEVIDMIVVLSSWVLDIVFFNNPVATLVGLLVFLRLWRIIRVVHGVALAAITPLEHEIEKVKETSAEAFQQMATEKKYECELEDEIAELRNMVKQKHPTAQLPPNKVRAVGIEQPNGTPASITSVTLEEVKSNKTH